MGGLAVAAGAGAAPGVALALTFACAAAGTPYVPAVTAMTPTLVPETSLAASNALVGTVNYLALVLGPALGTVALVLGSPTIAFAINAASFAASAMAVTRMERRPLRRVASESATVLRRAVEGLRPLFRSGETTVLAGFFVGQAWIYGLESVLLVLAAERLLDLGASGFGWLLAAIGAGGLVAAFAAGRLTEVRTPTLLLAAGVFAVGLPLASLSVIRTPWIAFVVLPLDGAGTMMTEVLAVTALQRSLREDLIGRAFAAMDALAFGAVLLGSFLAPFFVHAFGLETALIVAGASGPAATILVSPWLRTIDRTARRRVAALQPTIDILARTQILRAAPASSLELLAASLAGVRAAAGEMIVREGDEAKEFFVIVEGRVSALASDGRVLGEQGPGDHFGEVGILEGIPRVASVRAETPVKLFKIGAADFLGVINKSPSVRGALMNVAATRLGRPQKRPAGPSSADRPT
jgi:predicted MFS family arabinose efflux permease